MSSDPEITAPQINAPEIKVRASATVEAVPDEAEFQFNLSAEGRSSNSALDAVGKRLAEFHTLCDRLDIAETDRSSTVTVSEHGDRDSGRWLSKGYRATARVTVKVRQTETVGQLVSEAVSVAGPAVHGPYWRVTPAHPAHLQACAKAATQAKAKAETYVEALGVGLGPILSVTEPGTSVEPMMRSRSVGAPMAMAAGAEVGSEPALDLHPGTHEVRAEVVVAFAIAQV